MAGLTWLNHYHQYLPVSHRDKVAKPKQLLTALQCSPGLAASCKLQPTTYNQGPNPMYTVEETRHRY